MAQVNSTPGQSQAAGNQTVTSASSSPGVGGTQAKALLTTVAYSQSEPGKLSHSTDPVRN